MGFVRKSSKIAVKMILTLFFLTDIIKMSKNWITVEMTNRSGVKRVVKRRQSFKDFLQLDDKESHEVLEFEEKVDVETERNEIPAKLTTPKKKIKKRSKKSHKERRAAKQNSKNSEEERVLNEAMSRNEKKRKADSTRESRRRESKDFYSTISFFLDGTNNKLFIFLPSRS